MSRYFVAISFVSGGSLGFNVTALSETHAYEKVREALPKEMIELITGHIEVPQCRIDYRAIACVN